MRKVSLEMLEFVVSTGFSLNVLNILEIDTNFGLAKPLNYIKDRIKRDSGGCGAKIKMQLYFVVIFRCCIFLKWTELISTGACSCFNSID